MASLPSRPGGSSNPTEIAESPHQLKEFSFPKTSFGLYCTGALVF